MNDEKKIPKPVWFWLVLVGFILGNALGASILMVNIFAWVIINAVSVVGFFILEWRYGETLQGYIPRYKKQEKKEST